MINKCMYEGKCCMRDQDRCTALANTEFKDGECHFQKETRRGPNLYDQRKKEEDLRKGSY